MAGTHAAQGLDRGGDGAAAPSRIRASAPPASSLITAAIVHWNTVYLDRAVQQLRVEGAAVPDDLLAHVAPLGWEHIALTGDYVWSGVRPDTGFRPLRDVRSASLPRAA